MELEHLYVKDELNYEIPQIQYYEKNDLQLLHNEQEIFENHYRCIAKYNIIINNLIY